MCEIRGIAALLDHLSIRGFVSVSPLAEPSGQSFLSERYDTAIFCFSKDLPFASAVPGIPLIPAKEAKNRPTLSMR